LFFADRNGNLQGQVTILSPIDQDFHGVSMEGRKERVSQPGVQRTPRFLGPWTRLSWSSSYATHPKEYFKAIREENRRRDMTGWRQISRLKLPPRKDPAIERCKGGSRYIRKRQNEKKKNGRPAAGTEEARSQTAAACEANRKRHASNRKKQEIHVKQ